MDQSRPKIRLYVEDDLAAGGTLGLAASRAHYLAHVMRLGRGEAVALFNGRDGEWRARIVGLGRGWCSLEIEAALRPQAPAPDLWLVFAPIKRARLDFVAEKATEMGVSAIWPVFTRHTAVARVNAERLRANAIEAAEQCGRLNVPALFEPATLDDVLAGWPSKRRLLVCDETGRAPPVATRLQEIATAVGGVGPGPWAVLVGPEGGFARAELDALAKLPFVTAVCLGPRVLRADTASVAALACWQALLGDWRSGPTDTAAHDEKA